MVNTDSQKSSQRILILGGGWVGQDVAELMYEAGYEVWISTTSLDKVTLFESLGYHGVRIDFDGEFKGKIAFPDSFDFVLNSVPATSRNTTEVLDNRFRNVEWLLQRIVFKKHIFLSSIGVYPDKDGLYDEEWNGELDGRLLGAERIMMELPATLIYRLGGLFGKERIFAKYFSGRVCQSGEQPANFVHLEDVKALIKQGFLSSVTSGIYNIVAPEHPTKREVILASASKYGLPLPSGFDPVASYQKVVSGQKIIDRLEYSYKYRSPLYF
ncbi:Rossmann-fold NAD(P)-binding domain-containing protein [Sphingobacterium faecale]|uniref:GDP-L-fucose synthase n=1 Tax=Sphingobacterium faecale TaxID=2803775 RepID=A0ABS1R1U3_9SPHI|nr:GDP-L-fucose synthase [Sphingobacterium faecale]MBL1408672.1 GDP-L-fucose synthase [Sphingobacterium faecale]